MSLNVKPFELRCAWCVDEYGWEATEAAVAVMPNSEVQMHGTGQRTLAAPVLQPHNTNELWRCMKIAWRQIQGCQSTTFGDTSRSMTIRMASLLAVLILGTWFSSASARFPPHPVRHHDGCCIIKMLEYPECEWMITLPQGKEYWHIFNPPSVVRSRERSVCQSFTVKLEKCVSVCF